MLPRSLRSVAGAPNFGAEEKAGHSGRDDGVRKRKSEEHSQEWLCHKNEESPGAGRASPAPTKAKIEWN
jgi:hypothetical protein